MLLVLVCAPPLVRRAWIWDQELWPIGLCSCYADKVGKTT